MSIVSLKPYIISVGIFLLSLWVKMVLAPMIKQLTPGATGAPFHLQLTVLTKSFTQESPWGIQTNREEERDDGACIYWLTCPSADQLSLGMQKLQLQPL